MIKTLDGILPEIIKALKAGVLPWQRTWNSGAPRHLPVRHDGTPYRGINVLTLWIAGVANPDWSDRWMTYRQAQALGGRVRKGERASPVFFASKIGEKEQENGEMSKVHFFWKRYSVFNVAQIDGLPEEYQYRPEPLTERTGAELDARLKAHFDRIGARLEHEAGANPHYQIKADKIVMPPVGLFQDNESYWAALAHEHIHWTGHPVRLARFGEGVSGYKPYAMEELTAELGAALLCAELQISERVRDDHAQYLGAYIQMLKETPAVLFKVASAAQKAADYLLRDRTAAMAA